MTASMLAWRLRRLRAMGLQEVGVRTRRDVAVRLDDLAWRRAPALWRRSWTPPDERLFVGEPQLDGPLGLFDPARVHAVSLAAPGAVEKIVARARRAKAGRLALLGSPEVVAPDPLDPSHDLVTGFRWPDRHGKRIDFRSAGEDPKWIWEVNRCQAFPLLALAWRLSGDVSLAETAAARMISWSDRVPPGRGIAWANGFEAGLRAASLALCLDCLRGSDVLTPERARKVLRSLWQHGRFTLRDLSRGSSANNHLVGELAGVACVGLLAPELRDAPAFVRQGLDGLAREAARQILPDGTGAEQAFAYTLFVVDLMLLVVALAERRRVDVPPAIRAALSRAGEALLAQVAGDEPDPRYGDADDGRAFVVDADERRDARGVAAALASCLSSARLASLARSDDVTSLLLFGKSVDARVAATDADLRSVLLPDSGLVVLRREGTRVLFDAGPLGYLSIAAHGHADALQVTLCDRARDLVVDPGVGTYNGDPLRRAAFRGTAFHATVTVDGEDQAEQAGPFLWRRHYRTRLRSCDLARGVVVAEHDGYRRLPDPVAHVRTVVSVEGGSLLVHDRLTAQGSHRYAQTWPFAARLQARVRGTTVVVSDDEETCLVLAVAATSPGEMELVRGEVEPFAGWTSKGLDQMEPAWAARYVVRCRGPLELAALLRLDADGDFIEPELRLQVTSAGTQVTFADRRGRRTVEIDIDGARVEPESGAGIDAGAARDPQREL